MKRRDFVRLSASLGAVSQFVPTQVFGKHGDFSCPDFAVDPLTVKAIAGLRPYREESFRLESELISGRHWVHNYGHGGAGITMGWGCAEEVRDIVGALAFGLDNPKVLVIGSGVMGLTSALLLKRLGLNVTIMAKEFPPNTTSNIAGGQWAPSAVAHGKDPVSLRKFHRLLRRSFLGYEGLIGKGYGVSRRLNVDPGPTKSLEKVPRDIVPAAKVLDRIPIEGCELSGYAYETLLIEPPLFLSRVMVELRASGVKFVKREIRDIEQVHATGAEVVVNCAGLGARDFTPGEDKLIPVKGQLAVLPAIENAPYLFTGHGYVFPRQDGVIVGGTFEKGVEDLNIDRQTIQSILSHASQSFDGRREILVWDDDHDPTNW